MKEAHEAVRNSIPVPVFHSESNTGAACPPRIFLIVLLKATQANTLLSDTGSSHGRRGTSGDTSCMHAHNDTTLPMPDRATDSAGGAHNSPMKLRERQQPVGLGSSTGGRQLQRSTFVASNLFCIQRLVKRGSSHGGYISSIPQTFLHLMRARKKKTQASCILPPPPHLSI